MQCHSQSQLVGTEMRNNKRVTSTSSSFSHARAQREREEIDKTTQISAFLWYVAIHQVGLQ